MAPSSSQQHDTKQQAMNVVQQQSNSDGMQQNGESNNHHEMVVDFGRPHHPHHAEECPEDVDVDVDVEVGAEEEEDDVHMAAGNVVLDDEVGADPDINMMIEEIGMPLQTQSNPHHMQI